MLKESIVRNDNIKKVKRKPKPDSFLCSPLIKNMVVLCWGALIGGASLFNTCVIAGVAFVGALGCGIQAFIGLIGVTAGYLFFYGFDHSALYIGAALFVYTIAFIFQYTPFLRSKLFMPLIVFFLVVLIRAYGTINIVRGDSQYIWACGFEATIGGFLTYIYSFSLRKNEFNPSNELYIYSVFTILATILTRFPGNYIFSDFNFGSIAASVIIMSVIYRGNVQAYPIAAMFGAALQFGKNAIDGAVAMYLFFSIGDVFPLKKNKFLLSAYVLAVTCICECFYGFSGTVLLQLGEMIIASLVFCFIPKGDFVFEKNTNSKDDDRIYRNKALNIRRLSNLMLDISKDFPYIADSKSKVPDMNYVFDCALEQVCTSCEKKSICWEMQQLDSVSILNRTTKHITERGKLELEDLSNTFRLSCIRCHSMVLAVNYELRRWYLTERILEMERMNHDFGKRQNQLFGRILNILSYQLANVSAESNTYHQRYFAEIGLACKRKNGESVCGDSVKYFKTADGILYIILSDGVGSGEEAEKYSAYVVSLLENGLKLLCDPISVIELVHLTLQSLDWWAAATIDLAMVNLNSGELTFYKLGACASYVFTSDKMIPIEGNSCSAGTQFDIDEIRPTKLQIASEAIIVLVSDGVSLNMSDSFIQRVLQNGHNMKHTAKQLLLSREDEVSDDKTIITISIKERFDTV